MSWADLAEVVVSCQAPAAIANGRSQTTRRAIKKRVERYVRERDKNRCIKCWKPRDLAIHHIHAVVDGGNNHPLNLALLCEGCHAEWHMMAEGHLPFEVWVDVPPALWLVLGSVKAPPGEQTALDRWVELRTAREHIWKRIAETLG